MDGDRWRFVVRASCRITGVGVAAFGELSGTLRSGRPALLEVGGETTRVEKVDVEYALLSASRGEEEIVLLLADTDELVPPGAVVSGPAD